jgi:hypothetical protein
MLTLLTGRVNGSTRQTPQPPEPTRSPAIIDVNVKPRTASRI